MHRIDGTVGLNNIGCAEVLTTLKTALLSWFYPTAASKRQYAPLPVLLVVDVVTELTKWGRRLSTSGVVDTGQVKPTQFACLIGFGAHSGLPKFGVANCRDTEDRSTKHQAKRASPIQGRRLNADFADYEQSGISSVTSYRGAKLFTPIGLGQELLDKSFRTTAHSGIRARHLERKFISNRV